MAAYGGTALVVAGLTLVLGGVQDPVPPAPPQPWQSSVRGPATWVAFSAELEFFTPGQPPQYGRHVQDEHGCRLRETVEENGDRILIITNEQTNTTYRFARGAWTAQSMRPGPEPRKPGGSRRVDGKGPSFEGFETYVVRIPVRSPAGESVREGIVIPALNFFDPVMTMTNGRTITARNIVVGPQAHEQFHPPASAKVTPIAGIGGSMQFAAVVVSVTFPGQPSRELTTGEERPYEFTTPEGRTYHMVTAVIDWDTNEVRVRMMRDPKWSITKELTGEVLEEIRVHLGGSAETTKMPENFQLRITRIRDRWAK
jgi:hypothetical protein